MSRMFSYRMYVVHTGSESFFSQSIRNTAKTLKRADKLLKEYLERQMLFYTHVESCPWKFKPLKDKGVRSNIIYAWKFPSVMQLKLEMRECKRNSAVLYVKYKKSVTVK